MVANVLKLSFRRTLDVVVLLLATMVAWQYYHGGRRGRSENKTLSWLDVGSTVDLPGVDWSRKHRHVVLAFTTACKFCVASGEFYGRLSQWIEEHPDNQLIVVSPEPRLRIRQWMTLHGVAAFQHVQENFLLRGFRITPTIALVDSTGRVRDLIIARLTDTEEELLFRRLKGQDAEPLLLRIDQNRPRSP